MQVFAKGMHLAHLAYVLTESMTFWMLLQPCNPNKPTLLILLLGLLFYSFFKGGVDPGAIIL